MRILITCPYSWDSPGGVQGQVLELGKCLLARGHEVMALGPGDSAPSEPWVGAVGRPLALRYNRSVAPICPSPFSSGRVGEALRRFCPDLVHAHEPLVPSTSMFAVLHARGPVVATFHAAGGRARLFDLAAPLLRGVAGKITLRVAVSRTAASFAGARIGGDFEIIPNGVAIERFEEASPALLPEGKRLLFVGRLDERKGFPVAVRAFGRLAECFPDLWLVVVGDGPERGAVRTLPPALRARVHAVGRVGDEALPAYYAGADAFLAPSLGGESFGIVLVEAMAAGVPVVATDIPGYAEVLRPGVEGLLVSPGNPTALAHALKRLLLDPGLAARLGAAGRVRAKAFSFGEVVPRLEAVYERAVEASIHP